MALDPQSVAALAGLPLSEHTLSSLLERVCFIVRDALPQVRDVSATVSDGARPRNGGATSPVALDLDERQFALGHGPCVDGTAAAVSVLVRDMRTEQRWPDYTPRAVEHGVLSSLGVPLPVQLDVSAALNLYAAEPDAFDERAVEDAKELAAYAGVALANLRAVTSLQESAESARRTMDSRAEIEQAIGMVMGERRCPADQAFDVLVVLAQASGCSVRELAHDMVAAVGAVGAQERTSSSRG